MKTNTSNDEHELEARIMKIEKHIRYIKTQHCDGCEPNEMCNTCKENFRELRIPLNKLKAELKGIKQGYAKALDDVGKIIGKQVEWFNGIEDLEDNKLTLKVLDIIRLEIAKLAKEKRI